MSLITPTFVPPVPPSHVATEVLPSRTYIVTEMLPTEVIHPSVTHSTPPTMEVQPPTETSPIFIPTSPPTTRPTRPSVPDIPVVYNYEPILKNDMQNIVVQVGDVLSYQVPEETFQVLTFLQK